MTSFLANGDLPDGFDYLKPLEVFVDQKPTPHLNNFRQIVTDIVVEWHDAVLSAAAQKLVVGVRLNRLESYVLDALLDWVSPFNISLQRNNIPESVEIQYLTTYIAFLT